MSEDDPRNENVSRRMITHVDNNELHWNPETQQWVLREVFVDPGTPLPPDGRWFYVKDDCIQDVTCDGMIERPVQE